MNGLPSGKRSAGEAFRPPQHEVWNGMVDAGQAFRDSRLSQPAPEQTAPRSTDIVKVKNTCGYDRLRGEILQFDDFALSDRPQAEQLWFIGGEPTTADALYGVLLDPIPDGSYGRAQISGVCVARIDEFADDYNFAHPAAESYELKSDFTGSARILFRREIEYVWWAVVHLSIRSPHCGVYAYTPEGGIPARSGDTLGSAECALYTRNDDDELVEMFDTNDEIIYRPIKNPFGTAIDEFIYVGAVFETSGELMLVSQDCS